MSLCHTREPVLRGCAEPCTVPSHGFTPLFPTALSPLLSPPAPASPFFNIPAPLPTQPLPLPHLLPATLWRAQSPQAPVVSVGRSLSKRPARQERSRGETCPGAGSVAKSLPGEHTPQPLTCPAPPNIQWGASPCHCGGLPLQLLQLQSEPGVFHEPLLHKACFKWGKNGQSRVFRGSSRPLRVSMQIQHKVVLWKRQPISFGEHGSVEMKLDR